MTKAGDSIDVTPGSGATIASHTVSSKEHEVWMGADAAGNLNDDQLGVWATTAPGVAYVTGTTINGISLLNADAALIVDILGVWIAGEATSLPGAGDAYGNVRLRRMTAHSGGSSLTPAKIDTTTSSLDADITVRSLATSVTGTGEDLAAKRLTFYPPSAVGVAHEKSWLWRPEERIPIVCRQNEGIYVYGASVVSTSAAPQASFGIIFRVR